MSLIPGIGVIRGMAHTFVRIFEKKRTIQYPEVVQDISPHHRGRLVLLYDEYGAIKCETCFQCAQACPVEVIDMGGVDTRNRFHVHWGPAEQYGERREESALRRSGRVVPDATFRDFEPVDLVPLDAILADEDYDPKHLLSILARAQDVYGYLPVTAIKHISNMTGTWYSEIYGVASFYEHLRLEPPAQHVIGLCRCASCLMQGAGRLREALVEALGTDIPGTSPDGAVRVEFTDCHGDAGGDPYVTTDGQRLPGTSTGELTQLAHRLRAEWAQASRA